MVTNIDQINSSINLFQGKSSLVSVLELAYLQLLNAASITADTSILRAKSLAQNAHSQERLNQNAEKLKWYDVPKEMVDTHREKGIGTWHKRLTIHGKWVLWSNYKTYKYQTIQTIKNLAAVDNDQAKNQEVSAERDTIENKLNLLQQGASIDANRINGVVDDSEQTETVSSALMGAMKSLLYLALLRSPPQT